MQPLVSVIIPYYNSGNTIQETIDSVFNQSYPNFEIWIINDGSTDKNSIEKLKDFENNPKINILHQDNAGPSVARNNAIKKSKGKYIVFLDSDNKIRKEYIQKAIDIFSTNQNIAIVYSDYNLFGEKSGIHRSLPINSSALVLHNPIDNCVLIRQSVFRQVGGFDEFLSKKGLEDWELWIRLVSNNYRFQYIEEVLFDYRIVNDSRTQGIANKNLEEIKSYIYKKHSDFLAEQYKIIFNKNKHLQNSLEFKIGCKILIPYRFVKRIFKK